MDNKTDNFLDDVCVHIKYKPIHKDIRDELTVHINELKEEFIEETQNEETALDMAIMAMGDCSTIGKNLNKLHKPETDWLLIGLTAVISIIGGIIMYFSSNFEFSQGISFERYLFFVILGIGVMVGTYFFDYTKLKKLAWPLYSLSFVLLLSTMLLGSSVNGQRVFVLGGSVITSEIATLLFIVSFAGFIDKAKGKGNIAILKLLALSSISIILILMLPRTIQALTMLIAYAVLIISAITKKHFGDNRTSQFVFLGAIGGFGGLVFTSIFFLSSARYRLGRLQYLFSSFVTRGQSDPTGYGYNQVMTDKWLASSNLFGTANMNGLGLDSSMSSITTDYVLVNAIATLGWIVGIILIIAIAMHIVRMLITTKKIKNNYGFYLSLASCTILSVQFVTGVLVNFNLLPHVSVYIPLVSYGGLEYIVSMAFVGLVLSIWRRNNLVAASTKGTSVSVPSLINFDDGKLIIDLNQILKS